MNAQYGSQLVQTNNESSKAISVSACMVGVLCGLSSARWKSSAFPHCPRNVKYVLLEKKSLKAKEVNNIMLMNINF